MSLLNDLCFRIAAIGLLVIHVGYCPAFIKDLRLARILAWAMILLSFYSAVLLVSDQTPMFRMLVIIAISLTAMKSIVLVEAYKGNVKLNYIQWLVFSIGWFGMRPTLFEKFKSTPLGGIFPLLLKGLSRILIGVVLVSISNCFLLDSNVNYSIPMLFALVGLSFILHFGILNVSAASWRYSGVDCRELFHAPILSKSLKEFWGKRWNLAFSEMTAIVLYRPLKKWGGKNFGIAIAFLFSGFLHELAISVPVKTGYGFPMLYFALQGVLMYVEEHVSIVKRLILHPIGSRIWVLVWVILPLPILFHKAFVMEIVFPLVKIITASF